MEGAPARHLRRSLPQPRFRSATESLAVGLVESLPGNLPDPIHSPIKTASIPL